VTYTPSAASIVKKYQNAVQEAKESETYYQSLCETLDPTVQQQWEEEMANAQANRTTDIKGMDIFNPTMETHRCGPYIQGSMLICDSSTAPSCAEKQLEMIQLEFESHQLQGSTAWLAEGLAIQESQYVPL
jgi:hypothetical protein